MSPFLVHKCGGGIGKHRLMRVEFVYCDSLGRVTSLAKKLVGAFRMGEMSVDATRCKATGTDEKRHERRCSGVDLRRVMRGANPRPHKNSSPARCRRSYWRRQERCLKNRSPRTFGCPSGHIYRLTGQGACEKRQDTLLGRVISLRGRAGS